jgi:cold shock protein
MDTFRHNREPPPGRRAFSSRPSADRGFSRRRREDIMPTGTVKKVISDRGFGFITGEDGKDYFFHRDGLERSLDFDRLAGGEKVAFEIEPSARGPRAVKVEASA